MKAKLIVLSSAIALLAGPLAAQQVPHPRDVFGFEPGADYEIADYSQMLEYYR